MLRLTRTAHTVLTVDGRLTTAHLPLLDAEIAAGLQQAPQLTLRLNGLVHIDAEGLARLKQWCDCGVALEGGSPYVRALLQRAGLETAID